MQRVVGAALEYAEDPMEVCKWDVLHVLRKNKRFLARVKTTHNALENHKKNKSDSKGIGICAPNEEALKLLDSTTFDDDAAPARGDAAAAEAARRPDVSDAVREQADEMSAETRTHRFIKLRKTA
jgi:hypothetical protein